MPIQGFKPGSRPLLGSLVDRNFRGTRTFRQPVPVNRYVDPTMGAPNMPASLATLRDYAIRSGLGLESDIAGAAPGNRGATPYNQIPGTPGIRFSLPFMPPPGAQQFPPGFAPPGAVGLRPGGALMPAAPPRNPTLDDPIDEPRPGWIPGYR
jgi:hypothetical protein